MNTSTCNQTVSIVPLIMERIPRCFFKTTHGKVNKTSEARFQGLIKSFILFAFVVLIPVFGFAQGQNPNEVEWNGSGYSIKKVVSNTSIQSGVNFSYTILFTAPAGATTVSIQDPIPANLVVVNVPTPSIVNGVTPVVTTTGAIGSQVVNYSLTGLPSGSPSSGSFTIVVKFPEGTTCNGATARNRVGININAASPMQYTPYVSTTASAVDPWIVSKSILSGPVVNPNGGNCGYLMPPGDTVTYRLSVMKNSPYYGNVVGQQNMSSAVVTDVLPAGAVLLSSTCGIPANSTGTITWNPNSGNLDAANPWAYYWCDITVYYPSGSFPNGSFVYNQVTLSGTSCSQQVSHTSNQTCIEIGQVIANPSGYFQKYIGLTNRVPGCGGYYLIVFCNNGNVPLSAFNIDDNTPAGISVDKVQVFGGSPTTTMSVTANSGGNTIASSINTNYFDSGTIGFNVNDLQLQMTGSLPVGSCIYMYIYFTVEPNPTGTVVTNCATFNGLSNSLTLPQTCVSFTVDAGTPDPCILKEVCNPQTDYEPGDIIRMRLRVQNIGSAAIQGAGIQDILHSNFSYVGNESYYVATTYSPPCATGSSIPSGTTAWPGVLTNHSGNNLDWQLPDIASDCQAFYVGYCGYYGTWGLPYYFIEFDVMVDSAALPGVTPNNFDIYGGNLVSTETSNTVNILVVASFGQEVTKQISTDSGSTFGSSGTVSPGGTARYRLNYKNTSNVPVTSVNLVDLLPRNDGTNDWLVLNRSVSRGSQFDVTYNLNHSTLLSPTGVAPVPALSYAPGLNICLPPFGINSGCTTATWGATPAQNIRADYGTFILTSNKTVSEDFDVIISPNAVMQQTACNDFAAISTAQFLLNGNPQSVALTPIAAAPVCLTVDTTQISCCDSLKVERIVGADGTPGCCVWIKTDCDVDSIVVNLGNGTITSAAWNCGNIPPGAIGQSIYTFVANGCAADMTICFDPIQAGVIAADFDVYFSNGEKCHRVVDLDCKSAETDCCDSMRVEIVQNPTVPNSCCARLITDCEVKSVDVSVTNGTIASASWNCGALPSGYVGQTSFTFAANNCAVDMTTCVTPTQSGIVSVTYFVNFTNGDRCEKTIELDCPLAVHCCDSIEVKQVPGSNGVLGCCAGLKVDCDVDSVNVNITNGTISSASWSCGNIPAGYVGQGNYTFVASGCPVTMSVCADPVVTGIVAVTYTVYFSNGEKCDKTIELDCTAEANCCDSVRVEKVQTTGDPNSCCARLITDCEVKSVDVTVTNGTIASASWNCGALPSGYVGQSSFTFAASNCLVDMITCVTPTQSGMVTLTYTVNFTNGEVCEKEIRMDCKVPEPVDCCALVDFKIKQKWPHFLTQVGTFSITNLDPSSPICSVTISASPAATFSTGVLVVDGVTSSQPWNSSSIPATGNLTPSAVNTVVFSLIGSNYKGVITVCVVKCDGTKCCFDFKWNKNPLIGVDISLEQLPVSGNLVAVSINPKIAVNTDEKVKYVSFGLTEEKPESGFFAISAAGHEGDEYPEGVAEPIAAYMGKRSAFFELSVPKGTGENLGAFNLVFKNGLPKLGCVLFDEDGDILFSGDIDVELVDTVKTSVVHPAQASSMFEFLKLYPNPSAGTFTVTYATDVMRQVEIRLVNTTGQVVRTESPIDAMPGIHNVTVNANDLSGGLYKVILVSEGQVLSKSAVIKQ